MDELFRLWHKRNKTRGIKIIYRKGNYVYEIFPHEWDKKTEVEKFTTVLFWLAFADDVLFLTHSLEDGIAALTLFNEICNDGGMKLNFDKCGLLAMEWNPNTPALLKEKHVLIATKKIPVVTEYTYLGVTISASGKFDDHIGSRASKAGGVALNRMRKAKSWIGKDTSVLLPQLTQCFAPCLLWGTDVISLGKSGIHTLDVAFYKFLRRVYNVKFNGTSFTKTNQELLELSQMKPPSEIIPLAHLKFLFHLLSENSIVSPEPFFNGLIEFPNTLPQRDNKFTNYANTIKGELASFNLLHVEKKILSSPLNQKNIYQECARFGNSILASIMERLRHMMKKVVSSPTLNHLAPV